MIDAISRVRLWQSGGTAVLLAGLLACGEPDDRREPTAADDASETPLSPERPTVTRDPGQPDFLLDRALDADLVSPLETPPELGLIDLAVPAKPKRLSLEGVDWKIVPLNARALLDGRRRPAALEVWRGAEKAFDRDDLRFFPGDVEIPFYELPAFRDFRSNRDAVGRRRVVVTEPCRVRLPIVRTGPSVDVILEVRLGPGGGRSEALPEGFEGPPRMEVRLGDRTLGSTEIRRHADGWLRCTVPGGRGVAELDVSFERLIPGYGVSTLMLETMTVTRSDRRDVVLLPSAVPDDATIRWIPAAPEAARKLTVVSGRAVEEALLLQGPASIVSARAQAFDILLDGAVVASCSADESEALFEVPSTGVYSLEVVKAQRPGELWLFQSKALFLGPLHREVGGGREGVRGRDDADDIPLVRHVGIHETTHRSLLAPATTTYSVPLAWHPGDVLEWSLGALDFRPPAAPNASVETSVHLIDEAGTPRVLWSDTLDGTTGFEAHRVVLGEGSGEAADGWCGQLELRVTSDGASGEQLLVAWGEPWVRPAKPTRQPNVLVYLIDTLRADHLSCYGYERETSPRLDRFASKAVLFERAYSQAPWTRPSIASIFTGRYYGFHGAGKTTGLQPRLATLAESMRTTGRVTAGFIANAHVHGPGLNFEQGFGQFVGVEKARGESRASDVNELVFPWLDAHADQPFFLYVHTIDPHAAYDPPPETAGTFNQGYDGELTPAETHSRNLRDRTWTDEDRQYIVDLYDEEILFNDAEFGRLVRKLRDLDLYQDTIIIVTSDHGEEFGEHGGWGHGNRLWEGLIHVPLIIKPAGTPIPCRITDPVGLVDLFPTVAGLVDMPTPARSMMGVDLAPWWAGEPLKDRAVFSEEEPDLRTMIRGTHKLIEWNVGDEAKRRLGWYDLATDRGEQTNLAETDPEGAEALAAEMVALLKAFEEQGIERIKGLEEGEMSEAQRKALIALGYLDEDADG